MKITLKRVLEVSPSLAVFVQCQGLAVRAMFRLKGFVSQVGEVQKRIDEQRVALAKKHGHEIKPEQYKVDDDKFAEFKKEWEELLSEEVTLPDTKIKLDEFSGNGGLTPQVFSDLDFLFEE